LYQCKKFLKREDNQAKFEDNKATLRTTVQLSQDEYMSSFKSTTLEISKSSSVTNEEKLCNNPSYTTILNSTPNSIHFYHPKSITANRPLSISNQPSIATVTANDALRSKSSSSIQPIDMPIADEPIQVSNANEKQVQNKANLENSKHLSQPPLPPTQPPSLSDTYEKAEKSKRSNLLNLRKASLFRNSRNITIDSNSHKLVTSTPIISIPKVKLDAKLVKSNVTSASCSNQHLNQLKLTSNSVDLYESISTSVNNFEKKNKKFHDKLNSKLLADKKYDFASSNNNHKVVDNNTYYLDDASKNEANKLLIGVKEELSSDLSEISLNSKDNSVVLLKKNCEEAINQIPETCANEISGQEEYFPYQVCNPNKPSKEVVEKKELPKISLKHLLQKSLALASETNPHGTAAIMPKEKSEVDALKKGSIDQRHKVKVKLKSRNDSSSSNHRCKQSDTTYKDPKNSVSNNHEKKDKKAASETKCKSKTTCKHNHHHHHHHHNHQQQQHQTNHNHHSKSDSKSKLWFIYLHTHVSVFFLF
jgi:hypothetical protein